MRTSEQYSNEVHKLGRAGLLITLIILFAIPTIICSIYDIFPTIKQFSLGVVGLLAIFVPLSLSEVISYTPILGSASYITFITGNIINLKLPCAKNAMDITNVAPGSEEADLVATIAVGVSSMLTIMIIVLGVLLLVPLEPVLSNPSVMVASEYMLPALFGALSLSLLKSSGRIVVKGHWKAGIIPFLLIFITSAFIYPLANMEGFLLIIMIPLTIGIAKLLYNKKQIQVIYKDDIPKEEK